MKYSWIFFLLLISCGTGSQPSDGLCREEREQKTLVEQGIQFKKLYVRQQRPDGTLIQEIPNYLTEYDREGNKVADYNLSSSGIRIDQTDYLYENGKLVGKVRYDSMEKTRVVSRTEYKVNDQGQIVWQRDFHGPLEMGTVESTYDASCLLVGNVRKDSSGAVVSRGKMAAPEGDDLIFVSYGPDGEERARWRSKVNDNYQPTWVQVGDDPDNQMIMEYKYNEHGLQSEYISRRGDRAQYSRYEYIPFKD